ncbi:MAG: cation diffusion facilitator family transporter [Clostridiales bacterium]|nr:cation diffusion facilitator family transporter [Clostridiales bacterium]
MNKTAQSKTAVRVSVVNIGLNAGLAAVKLCAGLLAGSGALISDGINSASDIFASGVGLVGITMSEKKADEKHPFGHERLECVAAVVLAVILLFTAIGVAYAAIAALVGGTYALMAAPGLFALIAAGVSIVVKEGMFFFTRAAAKRTGLTALKADAWNHQSDVLCSAGSLLGVLCARLGAPVVDPVASLFIALFIGRAAVTVFMDAVHRMTDVTAGEAVEARLRSIILSDPKVVCVDTLRTRLFGNRIYVEAEIGCDGTLILTEAHDIAQRVHDEIETKLPDVKHCVVHVNPYLRR